MSIGSPISPTFCDYVMQDLEQIVLNSLNFDIPLYLRYVDDIILALPRNKVQFVFIKFKKVDNDIDFNLKKKM